VPERWVQLGPVREMESGGSGCHPDQNGQYESHAVSPLIDRAQSDTENHHRPSRKFSQTVQFSERAFIFTIV
jgi:hypothetical protein